MKIPLNQFEQLINETILKRGLRYFEKGHITELIEITTNEYEATVLGSETYTVHFQIENDTIVSHSCNCPYDMGPVCKHLVAVLFYFQQDQLKIDSLPKKSTNTKKSKNKTIKKQVSDILETISHSDLKEFTVKTIGNNPIFRNLFLATFSHLAENQSKEFYQKQIHSVLKSAAGRDGYIDWSEMKTMNQGLVPFLKNAEQFLKNDSYQNLFNICTALLEEMTEAFQYADDSNGDIGYHIDFAIEMLSKISKAKLSPEIRNTIFQYCISAFQKKIFSGWDWHLGILQIAVELIDNLHEVEIILDCLQDFEDGYEKERAQAIELQLIRKYKGEQVAQDYINEHIDNSKIREEEIVKAYNTKNFERAIQLAKDGIHKDEKEKPGLAKQWYDWLLKIAQKQQDIPRIIQYARYRLIHNFGGTQDYYHILKNTVDPKGWDAFLEKIILEVTPKKGWTYIDLIREIYIKEAWWDRLFIMVKENVSLNNIEQNENYLKEKYVTELIKMYSERIANYVDKYVGRSHYQTACRYLRRMKKLGGTKEVETLITYFRDTYPQRRALMDELNKV